MDRVTGYLTLRGTYLLQGFSFGTDQIRLPTSDGASHPSQGKLWTAQRNTITTWLQFERQELRPPFPTSSTHGKDTTTPKPHFGATRASPSQHQNRQDVYPRKLPLQYVQIICPSKLSRPKLTFLLLLPVAVLLINAIAVLSEDRFLARSMFRLISPSNIAVLRPSPPPPEEKKETFTIANRDVLLVNLSPSSYDPTFGSSNDASVKAKIINLIASVRTLMRSTCLHPLPSSLSLSLHAQIHKQRHADTLLQYP